MARILDEAIEKHRNIAKIQKEMYDICTLKERNKNFLRVAKEHEQLMKWLEELKTYREVNVCEYNKAIDDFICNIEKDARYQHPIEVIEVDRCRYIAEQLKEGESYYNDGWIPIDEKLPPDDNFILLSFSNFSVPIVGRYEETEVDGGNFFAGDEDETLISQDLYVNAWRPLPEPYREDD